MSYRPITDMWLLARAKLKGGVKYYGAYPGGFLERARVLIGAQNHPVLHVCAGQVRNYPYKRGFGPMDMTLDIDPQVKPDFLQDARDPWPVPWRHILMDPPYTALDAAMYAGGSAVFPGPRALLGRAADALELGGRVGLLHYVAPRPPASLKLIALVGVLVGFENRMRVFSVYERIE